MNFDTVDENEIFHHSIKVGRTIDIVYLSTWSLVVWEKK